MPLADSSSARRAAKKELSGVALASAVLASAATASAAEPSSAATAQALAARSCSIYSFNVADKGGFHLPERYTPKSWMTNKFSVELWLQHAMREHEWRATSAPSADLVLLEANYSMMCRAGKMFSGRFMWQKMNTAIGVVPKPSRPKAAASDSASSSSSSSSSLPPPPPPPDTLHADLRGAERVPKAFVLTDNECQPPWTGSRKQKGLIELTDHNPSNNDILAPFVLAKPWWLVGAPRGPTDKVAKPAEVPWAERRLLFFAGHVPKLYIRPTRYLIWRQVRRHPGVTALSATLNCTIGSFSVCKEASSSNFTVERSRTYCQEFCESHIMDDFRTFLHDAPGHARRNITYKPPKPSATKKAGRCINGIQTLRRTCRSYRNIDFADELGDMAKSAVNLPVSKYYAHAFQHKFCMAAPGDFVSTPKITEYVAMGAAGGCLPVLVLAGAAARTLPYTRWLDWCSIAFIVSDASARRDMKSVLEKLEKVTAEEAAAKRKALLAVRDAFVFRPPGGKGATVAPSAVDFLLGELCDASRHAKHGPNHTLTSMPLAGGPYSRCML